MKGFSRATGIAATAVLCLLLALPAGCAQHSAASDIPLIGALVTVGENVPPPRRPTGPRVASKGRELTFVTKGTDPLGVHLYQFDWGDGSWSLWLGPRQSHVYRRTGTFRVKARERCPLDLFTTKWSASKLVTIR